MKWNVPRHASSKSAPSSFELAMESLESRVLLSASSHIRHQARVMPHHRATRTAPPVVHAALKSAVHAATPTIALQLNKASASRRATPATGTSPSGYSPARLRTAYGINNINFGSIAGDGTGQTIAIVDAYRDPYIVSELHAFDQQFGLVDPTLTIVNQTGGSVSSVSLPPTSTAVWALETALDVEWAHALAPGAKILLVEATNDDFTNLIDGAVDYARHQPGVVAISMSWGGAEWSTESADEDGFLTTPAGHAPITFLAATGDAGQPGTYPAYSPSVVAVGGTSLTTDSNGNGAIEAGWSGSGGGISLFESQPAFQQGSVTQVTQSATKRTTPDISFAADPNNGGVSVYTSYDSSAPNTPSALPWQTVGGTSLATPAWGALVAIAAQGRSLAGLVPLDGVQSLLPRLYNLPTSFFRDPIIGNNGFPAGPGYDLVTGIGSPIANQLVPRLVSAGAFVVQSPSVTYSAPISSISVHFSEPMDTTSFSLATGIAGFSGPGGVDLSGQITGFSWLDNQTLQITFITQGAAGGYSLALTSQIKNAAGTFLDQNGNYTPGELSDGSVTAFTLSAATIANRAVFYNNSGFDNHDPGANAATDAAAIATDKTALLPGQTSTTANYTSYDKGINGIIIDLANLGGRTPTLADFSFNAGNTSTPAAWLAAPAPSGITIFRGAGVGGSDRVEIIWTDFSIRNQWLQVSMSANGNTGLAAADVFYFGNLGGETLNSANDAVVTLGDLASVKFRLGQAGVPVTSAYDFNRDGNITLSDLGVTKFNLTRSLVFPFLA